MPAGNHGGSMQQDEFTPASYLKGCFTDQIVPLVDVFSPEILHLVHLKNRKGPVIWHTTPMIPHGRVTLGELGICDETGVCPTSSPGPSPRSKWRSEKPWPRLLKYSKNLRVFCHVTHDEMTFSEVVSSVWRPFVFLQSKSIVQQKRRHFIAFTGQNPHEFLEPFWLPWPGVSPIRHFE